MSETNNLNPEDFVLVLSVGGSPKPLVESLKYYQPHYAVFVASRDSRDNVPGILQEAGCAPKYEIITLSDHQNLLACVRDMRYEIPRRLQDMKLPADILLLADFTGGTKVMSAALTLVMMEFNSRFTYVGGDLRNKDGLGTVESGHETIMQMDNPWDAMGLREARSLVQSFNAGQFTAARENADFIKSKDNGYRAFYEALGFVIDAFQQWEVFNYKSARNLLSQGIGRLGAYNNHRHENFIPLYRKLQEALARLETIARDAAILQGDFQPLAPGDGEAYLRDLVGNARRCAQKGHYDDAVARLYSAVEKTAKIALAQRGINNSCMAKQILTEANEELAQKHAAAPDDAVKLPLSDSFTLFCSLAPDNAVAVAYQRHAKALAGTLESRNMSLLAHGYNPVTATHYQKLYEVALQFLGMADADLQDFPRLEVEAIVF